MKRAFTLIELLVVIAIIAILAAILFPVFAQAKVAAKKTAAISNVKQTGTAFAIYTADADDTFPSSYAIDDGGACGGGVPGRIYTGWADNWLSAVPAGADDPSCGPIDSQSWVNSTQSYRKSYELASLPGLSTLSILTDPTPIDAFRPKAEINGLSMNGYLSNYSATAISQPSRTTLVWAGLGNFNARGYTFPANPILNCGEGNGPCRYNSGGYPSDSAEQDGYGGYMYGFTDAKYGSMWNYGRGTVFANADTSARFVQINPSDAEYSYSYNQPYGRFYKGGVGRSVVQCKSSSTAPLYQSFFKPDSEFNYPLAFPSSANICQ